MEPEAHKKATYQTTPLAWSCKHQQTPSTPSTINTEASVRSPHHRLKPLAPPIFQQRLGVLTMASNTSLSFVSILIALLFLSNCEAARHLLETPEVESPPHPTIPTLPKPELPPLPVAPTLPKPELPPVPEEPTMPKVELPPLPEIPKVKLPPKPSIPSIPKVEVPPMPSIPKVEMPPKPTIPEFPSIPSTVYSPPHP